MDEELLENISPTPEQEEDLLEDVITPTVIPDVYITDPAEFENTQLILDQYQYRVLNNQKEMVSLLFVLALEMLVLIVMVTRRRK